MGDTTIRVKTETRDALLAVAAADFGGIGADAALQALLDEHWKARIVADWDRLHASQGDAEQAEDDAEARLWDQTLADGTQDEPPYESEDPEFASPHPGTFWAPTAAMTGPIMTHGRAVVDPVSHPAVDHMFPAQKRSEQAEETTPRTKS